MVPYVNTYVGEYTAKAAILNPADTLAADMKKNALLLESHPAMMGAELLEQLDVADPNTTSMGAPC